MWKDLSMQQRADLMDIYLSYGVTSLDEMRRHYDSRDIDTVNAYREGGDIYIKPENRGKFTALKERTGHSATWFKEHGTPAQKKMATFALNARHWKHGLGGNLFDGTSQSSQQMDRPNIFRYDDGRYVYQAAPDAEEIEVSPINTLLPNPSQWTYQDAEGKVYTPHAAQVDTGSITQSEDTNPLLRAANNYMREAAYRAKDGTLALQGKYTMPAIAASALLPLAGEAAYPLLTNPYVDAAATSAFAGHGLNHAINEGINGIGDAAMTALEIAPLGRLAKPMWNAVKSTRNFTPTLESNMMGIEYTYNRNPKFANIGTLDDYNEYLKTVFPESKVRDVDYHMGPKGLQELKPSTGEIWNTNPNARGIYVTPDRSYAEKIRKHTTTRLENPSFWTYVKRNLTPGGWNKVNETFTDVYPVIVDIRDPLYTKGTWTWGIKDKKYKSLMDKYDGIVNTGPRWYQNFNSMPETIVPRTEQTLILGSDRDVAGFKKFMSQKITAENTATVQRQIGKTAPSGSLEETANAVERGRNALLDWIRSPFYKARLEDEPLYRFADDIVADAGKMIEEVPIDISKTKLELDPSGMVNGVTKTRPAIQTQLPDGTIIADLNTGLDVNVASDLGKDADETALHELLHYMTANSKGTPISKAGERIIEKGWMSPTETHFDAINIIHKNRGKGWQDYILDQNNALLPQYDPIVKMVMEEPNKAISFLEKAGKSTQEAKNAIQSLRARYSEWYDIQEQRSYLQQLFHSKIKSNLKNPNDAAEIEEYLSSHPEVLENFPAYKHIQEVRPGSIKDYAKYFSAALGTIPFISKPSKDE